jgi:hypothetical protein
MEPVLTANATTYAAAIMKIMLQFGFCHTCVIDKDSKFNGVCREALDLSMVNHHVLSGGNHNPMIVECLNCYLNAGLCIMTNEQDSTCIAIVEAYPLIVYGWNWFLILCSYMAGTGSSSPALTSLEVLLLLTTNSPS